MSEKNLSNLKETSWNKILVFAIVCIALYVVIAIYPQSTVVSKENTEAVAATILTSRVTTLDASTIPTEYVGRVEAIQSVSVKPQISGNISKVYFKEGSIVKEGDLLYQIEPQQYQATVQLRKAELEQAKANLITAERYYKRIKSTDKKAISATDRDAAEGDYLKAKAAVAQAKANLRLAQIDLGYCKITAPITGKIGKSLYTKGNYVTPSTTELANIVQMDPIRVTYHMPDRDYLDQFKLFKTENDVYSTKLVLSNGSAYDFTGERDFEDNSIDVSTGTITMNLKFSNADGFLIPGEMVRVFTSPAEKSIVTVIPLSAVMADSRGDYVYVVSNNIVQKTYVTLGREFGQNREVTGIREGTQVAVAGVHNLRDGMSVKIQTID